MSSNGLGNGAVNDLGQSGRHGAAGPGRQQVDRIDRHAVGGRGRNAGGSLVYSGDPFEPRQLAVDQPAIGGGRHVVSQRGLGHAPWRFPRWKGESVRQRLDCDRRDAHSAAITGNQTMTSQSSSPLAPLIP